MKKIPDDYFEDGYYYPPAPVGETIGVVLVVTVLMIIVIPLSLSLSTYLVR